MDSVKYVGKPNKVPQGGHKPATAQIRAVLQRAKEKRIAETPTEYDIIPMVYIPWTVEEMHAREG